MDDKLKKVLRTLELLLAYTKDNSSVAEFESAQRRAQVLITKYQIEESQLSDKSEDDVIGRRRIDVPGPYTIDKIVLLNVVAKRNFCKVLRGKDYALIYGHDSDIELVLALYHLLLAHMINEMLNRYDEQGSEIENVISWKKSFFGGYSIGVGDRLDEAKLQQSRLQVSYALVVQDKQQAIEKFWDRVSKSTASERTITDANGYDSGRNSARSADLGQTRLRTTPQLNR